MRPYSLVISAAVLLLLASCAAMAQGRKERKAQAVRDTLLYPNEYLDTVQVNNVFVINDYMLIGVERGASVSRLTINPPYNQDWLFSPEYWEVNVVRYGKLFGYMPYFGLKVGAAYGHEGFLMKANEETGYIGSISGATQTIYNELEAHALSSFHFDTNHFKIMLDIGPYAGKRVGIERSGPSVKESMINDFYEYDRRFDYGLKGGVGFGLVFDPIEFHVNVKCRYSWSNITEPDYRSPYYYSFGYPFDLMATAGVYFQMSKKTGKTKSMLRHEARKIVFGEEQ